MWMNGPRVMNKKEGRMKSNMVYLLFVSLMLLTGGVYSYGLSDQEINELHPQDLVMSRVQNFSVDVRDGISSVAGLGLHYTQTAKRIQVSLRKAADGASYISFNVVGSANPLNWSKIESDGSFQRRISQDYGANNQKLLLEYKGRIVGGQVRLEQMHLQVLDLSSVPMKLLRSMDLQNKAFQF